MTAYRGAQFREGDSVHFAGRAKVDGRVPMLSGVVKKRIRGGAILVVTCPEVEGGFIRGHASIFSAVKPVRGPDE